MALYNPGGGGSGGSGSNGGGGHPRKRHKKTTHHKRTRHAKGRGRKQRTPNVPETTQAHVGQTFGGEGKLPQTGPHTSMGAAETLELTAQTGGLPNILLELTGSERGTLRATLTAWQREQDRQANQAWRRPGGLARPAGL